MTFPNETVIFDDLIYGKRTSLKSYRWCLYEKFIVDDSFIPKIYRWWIFLQKYFLWWLCYTKVTSMMNFLYEKIILDQLFIPKDLRWWTLYMKSHRCWLLYTKNHRWWEHLSTMDLLSLCNIRTLYFMFKISVRFKSGHPNSPKLSLFLYLCTIFVWNWKYNSFVSA